MKTFHINLSLAEPGMVVAEDIYSSNDQLIISEGSALTDHVITRLKFYAITSFRIYDPAEVSSNKSAGKSTQVLKPSEASMSTESAKDIANRYKDELDAPAVSLIDPTNTETYNSRVRHSSDFKTFSRVFMSTLLSTKGNISSFLKNGSKLDSVALVNSIDKIFSSMEKSSSLFDMLVCINDLDDATYIHSTRVAIVCKFFAQWLHLNQEDSDNLVLAGFLHDIGKLKIDPEILKKNGKLTDDEINTVHNHSLYGYKLLKNIGLPTPVINSALMHHERIDGTGYPLGLKGDSIEPFAKIIAIVDVYDAMTSARSYRGPVCPLEVVHFFESEGFGKFDPQYLTVFLDNIVYTYIKHTVLLSNGQTGEIVMVNRNNRSLPVVRLSNKEFIDLSSDTRINIVGIL